jgi:hypothetical protein
MNSLDNFTLEPTSAGDIIDRAARLYRRNFIALVRTVLGPSIVAYLGSILYYIGTRNFSLMRGDARIFSMGLLIVVGFLLWLVGKAAFYAVLGGASRSLVHHFFDGTPLRARDVYQAVRERLWSLIGAMLIVGLMVAGLGLILYFIVIILFVVYMALAMAVSSSLPYWVQAAANVIFGVLLVSIVILGALLLYSRIVYVPQVLMVEGKGVYAAVSRSFALAGGESMRIGALILFWFYVAWSLLLLLLVPLNFYGYWAGVDINPFSSGEPLWFEIAQQTMTQVSEILIAPIAMLGFTLLYIDSRVRKEGFDVEMMANRVLPPPPDMPPPVRVPTVEPVSEPGYMSGFPSILGLNEYGPLKIDSPSATMPLTEAESEPEIEPAVVDRGAFETQMTAAPTPSAHNPDAISFIPVDAPAAELTSAEQNVDASAVAAPIVQETVATVPIENARRLCRWCGTEADVEDRFCRVCGSVF